MSKVAAGWLAVVATSFTAGCGGPTSDEMGTGSLGVPQIFFMTSDLSTGARIASIRIEHNGWDVPLDLVNAIAARVRVSTWPGDVQAPSSQTISTFPREQLSGGGERLGYGQIDRMLDATLDGNGWYGISLPQRPADYHIGSDLVLSPFADGALGVRISPSHPPVVSSVMSCPKDGGVVAVYASFSEPLTKPSGALALDYGAAVPCAVGDDQPAQAQFFCANATGAQPFSLRIADGVSATASGAPMAAATIRSGDMHVSVLSDGCSYYKAAIAD